MSIYANNLKKLSDAELLRECRSAYTIWLQLEQRDRDKINQRVDYLLMECTDRGKVKEIWEQAVAAAKVELAERRKVGNSK